MNVLLSWQFFFIMLFLFLMVREFLPNFDQSQGIWSRFSCQNRRKTSAFWIKVREKISLILLWTLVRNRFTLFFQGTIATIGKLDWKSIATFFWRKFKFFGFHNIALFVHNGIFSRYWSIARWFRLKLLGFQCIWHSGKFKFWEQDGLEPLNLR